MPRPDATTLLGEIGPPTCLTRRNVRPAVGRAGGSAVAAGGRFVVKNMPVKVYEGGIPELTVVLEFESTAAAIATYESAAYQGALKILGDAVEREVRIVEEFV